MKYAVYYRPTTGAGAKCRMSRAGEWVKSSRSRIGETFKGYSFETYEAAKQYADSMGDKYETQIKEVKR